MSPPPLNRATKPPSSLLLLVFMAHATLGAGHVTQITDYMARIKDDGGARWMLMFHKVIKSVSLQLV